MRNFVKMRNAKINSAKTVSVIAAKTNCAKKISALIAQYLKFYHVI